MQNDHRARHRGLRAGLVGAAVLAAALPSAAGAAATSSERPTAHAAAEPQAAGPRSLPSPDLPGLTRVAPALAEVELTGAALGDATEGYADAFAEQAAARDERVALDRAVSDQVAASRALRGQIASANARAAAAAARRAELDGALQDLAVALYIDGGQEQMQVALADPQPSVTETERKEVLATTSMETLLAERAVFVQIETAALDEAAALTDLLTAASDTVAQSTGARPAAQAAEAERSLGLAAARSAYEEARVLAGVDGSDFPLVALDAYWKAAERLSEEQPLCALHWWAVAGISRVEGRHGTYGGAQLDRAGNTTIPIIGIQLNGTNFTRAIGDTDGGELDGDPAFDRAVGPMQFIPSTWARWQADGNDDGNADPHNLYDAALAAAGYLCHGRAGLDTDEGLRAGYFSYNHSEAYVENVLGWARGYEQSVVIDQR